MVSTARLNIKRRLRGASENSAVSGDRVTKLKQFIAKKYLINLPGYGTVILRSNKADFQVAVKAFRRLGAIEVLGRLYSAHASHMDVE